MELIDTLRYLVIVYCCCCLVSSIQSVVCPSEKNKGNNILCKITQNLHCILSSISSILCILSSISIIKGK